MATYDFAQVMAQTRRLAAQYREATGQSLPVTVELARFDAITILGLKEVSDSSDQAIWQEDNEPKRVQIKGRVIFPGGKSRQRVGQLNLQADWDATILVIYDPEYQPVSIYKTDRQVVEAQMSEQPSNKRGAMTVAKFKAIGQCVWDAAVDIESASVDQDARANKKSQ